MSFWKSKALHHSIQLNFYQNIQIMISNSTPGVQHLNKHVYDLCHTINSKNKADKKPVNMMNAIRTIEIKTIRYSIKNKSIKVWFQHYLIQ